MSRKSRQTPIQQATAIADGAVSLFTKASAELQKANDILDAEAAANVSAIDALYAAIEDHRAACDFAEAEKARNDALLTKFADFTR